MSKSIQKLLDRKNEALAGIHRGDQTFKNDQLREPKYLPSLQSVPITLVNGLEVQSVVVTSADAINSAYLAEIYGGIEELKDSLKDVPIKTVLPDQSLVIHKAKMSEPSSLTEYRRQRNGVIVKKKLYPRWAEA